MTLRFLLDEDMPPAVAEGLRREGYDAVSVHDELRTGLADEEQLHHAATLGRMLVTYNRADYHALDGLWHAREEHHRGIIWVAERSIPRRAIGLLVRSLAQVADEFDTLDDLVMALQRAETT